jgi:hypothetical protein
MLYAVLLVMENTGTVSEAVRIKSDALKAVLILERGGGGNLITIKLDSYIYSSLGHRLR